MSVERFRELLLSIHRSDGWLIVDCDGVLTGAESIYSTDGKTRVFSIYDGSGALILEKIGFNVAIASTDNTGLCKKRAWDLSIKYIDCQSSKKDEKILENKLSPYIYIGDDIGDLCAMSASVFSVAPSSAPSYAKAAADYTLASKGGCGVLLEVALEALEALGMSIDSVI